MGGRLRGPSPGPILALDTGSPVVSVALATATEVLGERSTEISHSSQELMGLIDQILGEAGLELGDLAGVVALQGPGSFTGLRVGLATVLGFHLALGLPATALSTLEVLATFAPPGSSRVVGAVDALRDQWMVQPFTPGDPPRSLADPALHSVQELPSLAPAAFIGFGVSRLEEAASWPPGTSFVEPGPLAGPAARLAARSAREWDPARLTSPLYFRPPAVTLPKGRRGGAG